MIHTHSARLCGLNHAVGIQQDFFHVGRIGQAGKNDVGVLCGLSGTVGPDGAGGKNLFGL
jgi:hypothetical protein